MIDTFASLFTFFIFGLIIYIFVLEGRAKRAKLEQNPSARLHCIDCGSSFQPRLGPARGNGWIEIVMYFFMILPGVMYSIWRRSGSGKRECTVCGSSRAVPFASPAAVAHRKTLGID